MRQQGTTEQKPMGTHYRLETTVTLTQRCHHECRFLYFEQRSVLAAHIATTPNKREAEIQYGSPQPQVHALHSETQSNTFLDPPHEKGQIYRRHRVLPPAESSPVECSRNPEGALRWIYGSQSWFPCCWLHWLFHFLYLGVSTPRPSAKRATCCCSTS